MATILDSLLYNLINNKQLVFNDKTNINFIGIGFGGLILQSYRKK